MAGGAVATEGLRHALNRAEPTVVERSWDYKDVGTVEVLVTPKDVVRRSGRTFWHYGRAKYPLGHPADRAGGTLAAGLFEGRITFPDKCASCLAEPDAGVVYEMRGEMLEGGSGRFRAKDRRVVVAANWERIWYSVPYCETHARKPHAVAFGETLNNLGWITFRNAEYAAEFEEVSGLEPRHFVRRWWAALVALAAVLLLLGIGNLATSNNGEETAGSLPVGIVLLLLGIALLWHLYAQLVAPWRDRRKPGAAGRARNSKAPDAHRKRDDGYCAHCHQPWPCAAARDAGGGR